MEEESSEGKQKSLPYYVSDTQANGGVKVGENVCRKPVVRYWHTNVETSRPYNHHPFKKVNTPNNTAAVKTNNPAVKTNTPAVKNNTLATKNTAVKTNPPLKPTTPDGKDVGDNSVPKKEKSSPEPEPLPPNLLIFQSINPQLVKKTIEILDKDEDDGVVSLESSDEDEVIEVALPPKPTIMIESSDDEEVTIQLTPTKNTLEIAADNIDRDSTSPVPSVVSSVSDDFIRGDCIALNISSRHPDNHSFDFSLHGPDLNITPSKKKKRKRNKENLNVTTTPIVPATPQSNDTCFATPKSRKHGSRRLRKIKKLYSVTQKTLPNPDVSDSDSNQSIIDFTKNTNTYIVTENSVPSLDVYESNSNASKTVKDVPNNLVPSVIEADSSDSSFTPEKPSENVNNASVDAADDIEIINPIIDLTAEKSTVEVNTNKPAIEENIVMGNVTGFQESEDYGEQQINLTEPVKVTEISKYASTKVPAILFDNLDFDNLNGKDGRRQSRRYSLTTLRAEMEKFYNESWGGEDFNHHELQKHMSRDKSLWAIDPKDRMPSQSRRRSNCSYCNRPGHRDDMCHWRPAVCYMCGNTGHFESRCPRKICVNCGTPNLHAYSTQCRNCATWNRVSCACCGQYGHPASHCPDMWRRYHNTTDLSTPLAENCHKKKYQMMFCSGCAQRGHLIHACRFYIPFSGLPINSPYVHFYRPIYSPIKENEASIQTNNQNLINKSPFAKTSAPDSTVRQTPTPKNNINKRQSKSPTVHESHSNKKRNMSTSDGEGKGKSPGRNRELQRKLSQSSENRDQEPNSAVEENVTAEQSRPEPDKAPDFIPISSNRDKKGQMIQDNEVSDTSDVVTSARVYITTDIADQLKTEEGQQWLKETAENNRVIIGNADVTLYLSIKGKVMDQDSFQAALRNWAKKDNSETNELDNQVDDSQKTNERSSASSTKNELPKNRLKLKRTIEKALNSLKAPWVDPKAIYKELTYLRNQHQYLLAQKEISEEKLSNSRMRMSNAFKALNLVLLGQAGLADGRKHVAILNTILCKLHNLRAKAISHQIRQQVAYHYNTIFSATPRHDYEQLIQWFNKRQQTYIKKKKSFTVNPKKKMFNPIPLPQKNLPQIPVLQNLPAAPKESFQHGKVEGNNRPKADIVKANFNKLVFYHKRLLQARPNDAVLKKTKSELVRKLHMFIGSLGNGSNTPSGKTLKKVKRVQEQAEVFLNNQQRA